MDTTSFSHTEASAVDVETHVMPVAAVAAVAATTAMVGPATNCIIVGAGISTGSQSEVGTGRLSLRKTKITQNVLDFSK